MKKYVLGILAYVLALISVVVYDATYDPVQPVSLAQITLSNKEQA